MTVPTLRRAEFPALVETLRSVDARKLDVVAPASALRVDSETGRLVVSGAAEPLLTETGVTTGDVDLDWMPTAVETASDRLGVPIKYWRRCAESSTELLARNVNHWLADEPSRRFLVRALTPAEGTEQGHIRALLSDGFNPIDNLDVTLALLAGIRDAGVDPSTIRLDGDLTDRRLSIRVTAPTIAVQAVDLAERYSHRGLSAKDAPAIWGGLVVSNSETGGGAWSIMPRLVQQVCTNGMTRPKDAIRNVHRGARLDEGVIRWSDDTRRKEVDLISAKCRDAVRQFLSPEYVEAWVNEIRETAGIPVEQPVVAVERMARTLGFAPEAADQLMGWFIDGGDRTVFGLAAAATAWAKETDDADAAAEVEGAAWDAALAAVR